MGFQFQIKHNHMEGLPRETHKELGKVISKVATDIVVGAQLRIIEHDLIDTGAGLNSVQAIIDTENLRAVVIVGQWYMIFHEFGAPGANIPPRPFLGPAIDAEERDFRRAIAQALNRAAEAR